MRLVDGLKSQICAVYQVKSIVGCPARLRKLSTGCEKESNGEHFWPAIISMFERVDNLYLALEEVHRRTKFD